MDLEVDQRTRLRVQVRRRDVQSRTQREDQLRTGGTEPLVDILVVFAGLRVVPDEKSRAVLTKILNASPTSVAVERKDKLLASNPSFTHQRLVH